MSKNEVPADARSTKEYSLGKQAFAVGKEMEDCPYPEGGFSMSRISWLCGWLDSRTNKNLGHIFAKYNMVHP